MYSLRVYRCARLRRLGATSLALLLLLGLDCSQSFATFIDFDFLFGSSSAVSIRVVDTAGPIDVDDDFTGTASNGLPTIEIHEKLFQPNQGGTETVLWSDVEIEICLDKGSDGSVIDKIDDAIDDIKDLIDKFFGSWGNNNNNQTQQNYGPEEENDWENGVEIGIDKFVTNKAGILIPAYRIVLGTGIGDDFVPSSPDDDLYFLSDPMPKEVTDYFENPPGANNPFSDYLQWTSDGMNAPGLNNTQRATFWFGVHVPRDLFTTDPRDEDKLKARITLRQHTEVPEPTSLVLLCVGAFATAFPRRNLRTVAG